MTENRSKTVVIIALCLTLIFMGVGFAALSQSLTITTTGTISGATEWDVRLTGFSADSSVGSIDAEGTALVASFSLAKPGDSVTFTGSIKNFGSIDAELESITNGDATKAVSEYITRTITAIPTEGSALNADASTPVSITYTFNAATEQLPETAQTVEDVIAFNYIQK